MIEAIPIVNSQTGEQTGSITVDDHGNATISGRIDVPWGSGEMEELVIVHEPHYELESGGRHVPVAAVEPPDPVLTARLEEMFPSAYDRLMAEGPRHVAAAARGLAVHERALVIAAGRSIPYEQAIQIAAEEAEA